MISIIHIWNSDHAKPLTMMARLLLIFMQSGTSRIRLPLFTSGSKTVSRESKVTEELLLISCFCFVNLTYPDPLSELLNPEKHACGRDCFVYLNAEADLMLE